MSGSTFCWSTKQTCIKIHMCSYWVVYLLLNRSLIVEHCSGSNGELPGFVYIYIYMFMLPDDCFSWSMKLWVASKCFWPSWSLHIHIYICKHIKEANLDIILHCGVLSFFLTILNSMERKWWSWFFLGHWPNCNTKGSERMWKPFSEFLSCHNSDQFNTTS